MASLGSASPAGPPPLVDGLTSITPEGDTLRVREVWASNLEAEMAIIQSVRRREARKSGGGGGTAESANLAERAPLASFSQTSSPLSRSLHS